MRSPGCRLLFAAALAAAACGPGAAPDDAEAINSAESPAADSSTADAPPQRTAAKEDPFLVFGLSGTPVADTTIVEFPLRLVNETAGDLVVSASGGAGPVVLDTVRARDSVLVRIRTRADSVHLSASPGPAASSVPVTLPTRSGPQRAAFPR